MIRAVLFALLICVVAVSAAGALEPICPGGTLHASRPDITWCSDYDNLANCTTGQETSCWTANNYSSSPTGGAQDDYQLKIVSGGVVGPGFVRCRPRPGGTACGNATLEPVPGFTPLTSAMNYRYYIRYAGGFLSHDGGHNVQIEASGTGGCGSALKFQHAAYTGITYYPLGCAETSINIPVNTANSPLRLNNRWYAVEVHSVMDTVWTPRIDSTLSLTMTASTQTLTRSSGSFIDDGWAIRMRVMTTGFSDPKNNGQWTIADDGLTATTLKLSTAPENLADETATARLRSMEQHDANGVVQVWLDGNLITDWHDLNLGGVTNTMRWGWRMFVPESYMHYGVPPWSGMAGGFEIDWDNVAVSNNGTYIGCANSDGSSTCPGDLEGARGTGDPSSPYMNQIPYGAYIGRHAGNDCTNASNVSEYFTSAYRTAGNTSLDPTVFHGTFVDSCSNTIAWRDATFDSGHRVTGMIFKITNGNSPTDCTQGGGSNEVHCRWSGAAWEYTSSSDASMKVTISSASDGGGAVKYRPDDYPFTQWASYGWIRLPAGNTYPSDGNLALAGFTGSDNNPIYGYVALSVTTGGAGCAAGCWAIAQKTDGGVVGTIRTSTPVTYDTWHEYEVMLWKNGAGGCASANGCISLMIDHARLVTVQALPQSAAWAFQSVPQNPVPKPVVGVIDFQGTPPFTAYFDDSVVTTASAWSGDGWGTSNPFGGGSGGSVVKGVTLKGVTVK